ncbi:MAG TPA: TetR/AcrR family transcriptional regulator [Candidatus Limnocylindrales bacterium]|nr:TetR/AcrR family transcriptional regulator [Candidatus Limnocylindrales bacterium]
MRKTHPGSRTSQERLQHILHHSARVFSEKGFDGASIRDISRSSGVSLAGLYYYVESKQQLLYLIQIYTFKAVLARLEKRLAGVKDPVERLRLLIHNHLDYFLRHPVEMKVLSHEDEALEGEFRKEVLEIKRRYYDVALDIFEEMRRQGLARRLNPRVAVLSLFGMMNWIYTWHRPEIDPQADALSESMAGLFLQGVVGGDKDLRVARGRLGGSRRLNAAARAAV